MPLQKLQFRPGINREGTNYSNEGGWFACDKVRFRSGYPEKLGGWTRATPDQTYQGVCRALINWSDLSGNNLVGVGTHLKYYINPGMTLYYDITPIRATATGLTNPFESEDGTRVLTVTDAGHGANVNDFVTFSGATAFNNVAADALNAEFQIFNVIDGNTYQVTYSSAYPVANATGSGGGTVDAAYQINTGLPAYTIGNGYGAGIWNGVNVNAAFNTSLTYTSGTTPWVLLNSSSTTINVSDTSAFPATGTILVDAELITYSGKTSTSFTGCVRGFGDSTAAEHGYRPGVGTLTAPAVYSVTGYLGDTGWGNGTDDAATGVSQQMRIWTNDNFGQNLLMAPRGGAIYYWENNTSTYDRAITLQLDAQQEGWPDYQFIPNATNQLLVSDVSRFIICMGANPYDPADANTTFDPMLVRWSDQENPYVWVPDVTNQSGEQRLSNGSYIVQAKKNRQEILIWTDTALYSMQFLGPPYIFGFNLMMDNLSIMGPNAATVVNNIAYWMGTDKFYMYSGTVQTLPCALRQYIFDDLSFEQRFQTVAGTNEAYNEVWWFYVSQTEVNTATEENRVPVIDRYVVYNHLERIWYYGTMRRTFWLDSALQQYPLAAYGTSGTSTATGTMLFHENGNDDGSTATTVPFTAYVESSDFDIGDGHNFGYVWRIIPDINFTGSDKNQPQAYFKVAPRDFPGAPYTKSVTTDVESAQVYTPYVKQYLIQEFTQQVYSRLRGRQMSFRVESADQLGVAWQLGAPRLDVRPDGRR